MDRDPRNGPDRPSPSSSDDDTENLIARPDPTKPSPPHRRRSSSALEITGAAKSRIASTASRSKGSLLLLLAVAVPLIALLAYVFVDVRRLSAGLYTPTIGAFDSSSDRMREAELRALSLLRSQQAALLRLWNRTLVDKGRASSSNSSESGNFTAGHDQRNDLLGNSMSLGEFRAAVVEQVRLNREIQEVLLSSHRGHNTSSGGLSGNSDGLFSGGVVDVCRKVYSPTGRRTIDWKPKEGRYLFAICLSGQMSNHLICLEKHMLFAALLDRVLVLGSPRFDYQYDKVIEIGHVNNCFGRKVLITFEQFAKIKKDKMKIDKFICYMADPPCYVDEEHARRLKALGLSLAKLEAAWPKSVVFNERFANDIKTKFGCNDEVLAVGDLFYAKVEEELAKQPGGPLAHSCKTLIQPSQIITSTAERFIQTFLGSNFIALHFRRHGFLTFWYICLVCMCLDRAAFISIKRKKVAFFPYLRPRNAYCGWWKEQMLRLYIFLLMQLIVK